MNHIAESNLKSQATNAILGIIDAKLKAGLPPPDYFKLSHSHKTYTLPREFPVKFTMIGLLDSDDGVYKRDCYYQGYRFSLPSYADVQDIDTWLRHTDNPMSANTLSPAIPKTMSRLIDDAITTVECTGKYGYRISTSSITPIIGKLIAADIQEALSSVYGRTNEELEKFRPYGFN